MVDAYNSREKVNLLTLLSDSSISVREQWSQDSLPAMTTPRKTEIDSPRADKKCYFLTFRPHFDHISTTDPHRRPSTPPFLRRRPPPIPGFDGFETPLRGVWGRGNHLRRGRGSKSMPNFTPLNFRGSKINAKFYHL